LHLPQPSPVPVPVISPTFSTVLAAFLTAPTTVLSETPLHPQTEERICSTHFCTLHKKDKSSIRTLHCSDARGIYFRKISGLKFISLCFKVFICI